ncbi:hypothetical protein [Peribacillus frigoritolerans]|uniref:hypothetical protein n=1 Tax=Peribacillus frigoritolerans TaxID=450367 RepID=UPI00207ACFF8|nr:hypothetical protein [Peribacillus frigoritolerans]MEE3953495.1 hypothetical protein [Peribacillus frigoritolerans]USK63465.1 hypothetical protein LIT26_19845 [Peribacillus frigoritolerans]
MFKKILMLFGLLITFIGISSFQSDLANAPVPVDEEVILLTGNDVLVEKDVKTAKKQREKVMQDVASHPELVQFATEVNTLEEMPYSFNFDFK